MNILVYFAAAFAVAIVTGIYNYFRVDAAYKRGERPSEWATSGDFLLGAFWTFVLLIVAGIIYAVVSSTQLNASLPRGRPFMH